MNHRLNLFLILFSMLLTSGLEAQQILSDSLQARLRVGVKGFQDRYHSPSIAVAIVHGNDIIFEDAQGFTDLEEEIPATVNSKYQIQSITKLFTATMFMQLWERGVVDLDEDVQKLVPEYSAKWRKQADTGTTLLELATHNSGLPRNSPADVDFAKQVDRWLLTKNDLGPIQSATMEAFIRSLQYIDKEYPEYRFLNGNTRHYSNLGYGLLGLGLERAAATGYEEYVLSEICKPLKLADTGFGTFSSGGNIIAKGYFYAGDEEGFIKTPDFYPNSMVYAGGMYSTASDLAKFISAQFDENNPIISGKSLRMMQRLGIGWLRNYPFVVHEGSMLGARSEIIFNPELKIGWVVLANTTDFQFDRINDYIAELIVPLFIEKPVTELQEYVGTYVLEGSFDSLKIYLKDGNLYSTYLDEIMPDLPLVFSGNNSLTAAGNDGHGIHYRFNVGSQSEITSLTLNQLRWIKE
ncbi:CubicO group peptidase (beta-lactamase class C family) [Algoriphagus sp. 4150]|uniref:serine hydrolase domain-containing protein n=1 Tax=Algoriphagus sp. 4150 TaxID=2817756 RepID=UPI00285DF59F|nr:serine hydrolase domain-containing protein [Algoriphagus sp. 4150]MDR7132783.1 CubicO group peptidase (beta-lactamase class C family) [Algoriphagus sp. 4150]